ncbi:hypothetical protein ACWY4P_49250 [Streptomyces sp. LZ34]
MPTGRAEEMAARTVKTGLAPTVLLFIDVAVGALLRRMGMTGEPMVDADVAALVEMVLRQAVVGTSRHCWQLLFSQLH